MHTSAEPHQRASREFQPKQADRGAQRARDLQRAQQRTAKRTH